MRRSPLIAVALVAVLLAGCGGAANASHTVSSEPGATIPAATTPARTSVTVTLTQTTATTTSTTSASASACTAAELKPAFLGQNGAAGHVALGFALRNAGSSPCHTYGFPGVQLVDQAATAVGDPAQRTTHDLIGAAPAQPLSLAPGQEASFRVIVSDVGAGSAACPSAVAVQVIAPDDTARMVVRIPAVQSCGAPTVTPLQAGTAGYPVG